MNKLLSKWILIASLVTMSVQIDAAGLSDQEITGFANHMRNQHGFDAQQVTEILRLANINDAVLERISKPAEGLPWHRYRKIFLTDDRIQAGVGFWRTHQVILDQAEQRYGVPPEIITAIIGVETFYGERAGKDRVLDSLATLGFRYPRRAKFFRSELESFLLLVRDEGLDPFRTKGSYAGAMGIPQFIASSYRAYAVDFDGDNVRNLLSSTADAIGSVANYLAQHGWRRGESIAFPAKVTGTGHESLLAKGIEPKTRISAMQSNGVTLYSKVDTQAKAALMDFELTDGVEYWVGLKNFYVITRYNHSSLYALAVLQLSQAIKERYQG